MWSRKMRFHGKWGEGWISVPDADGCLHNPVLRQTLVTNGDQDLAPAIEAVTALRLAARRLHLAFARWAESHSLSESRFAALSVLSQSSDRRLPLSELAAALEVVPRTMTDIVDTLERDGLVVRVPDQSDRRSTLAEITDAGLERIHALRRDAIERQAQVLSVLSREQLAQLRHLCLLLVQNLEDPALTSGREG